MCLRLNGTVFIAAVSLYVITVVYTPTRDVINIYIVQLQVKFTLIMWVRNEARWKRRGITWCIFLSMGVISQLDSKLLQLETCVAVGERKDQCK